MEGFCQGCWEHKKFIFPVPIFKLGKPGNGLEHDSQLLLCKECIGVGAYYVIFSSPDTLTLREGSGIIDESKYRRR